MDKLLFALYLIVSSGILGVAAFGTILSARLYFADDVAGKKKHLPRVFVKVGYVITSSILLSAFISTGSIPSSWRSWGYLTGLVLTGVGLILITKDSATEIILHELRKDTDGQGGK